MTGDQHFKEAERLLALISAASKEIAAGLKEAYERDEAAAANELSALGDHLQVLATSADAHATLALTDMVAQAVDRMAVSDAG